MPRGSWLAVSLAALGAGLALNSLLGPLVADAIDYHYSETLNNQGIGLDAVALVVAVPLGLIAAVLCRRGHPAGPALAFSPAAFGAYMLPQYVIGPDYLGLPGNNERFFALHFGLFTLAIATLILAWSEFSAAQPALLSRRFRRAAAGGLIVLPVFMIGGLYIESLSDALSSKPDREVYLDNPTAFWIVAFLDLAVMAPASLAAAIGLLRGANWATNALYAVAGWFLLVPPSVAAMAIVMLVNDDPNASNGQVVVFGVAAVVFAGVGIALYRPLFQRTVVTATAQSTL